MLGNKIKMAVGPLLYCWPAKEIFTFYAAIAESAADIVYLGETVCSKRRPLRFAQWIELARDLQAYGKEVVLSTLTLIEAESELGFVKRLIDNGEFIVECNDMAAVNFAIEKALPFITGPSINIYNVEALVHLSNNGLVRWVPPVESSHTMIVATLDELKKRELYIETEIFSYGYLPLAYSARCFTARHNNIAKDNCAIACESYPDGIIISTQDNRALFRLNGIQTQSFDAYNLLPLWHDMQEMGIHSMRLSLSSIDDVSTINKLNALRSGIDAHIPLVDQGGVNGFWFGQAGMASLDLGD